jgi:hypothetical protein
VRAAAGGGSSQSVGTTRSDRQFAGVRGEMLEKNDVVANVTDSKRIDSVRKGSFRRQQGDDGEPGALLTA